MEIFSFHLYSEAHRSTHPFDYISYSVVALNDAITFFFPDEFVLSAMHCAWVYFSFFSVISQTSARIRAQIHRSKIRHPFLSVFERMDALLYSLLSFAIPSTYTRMETIVISLLQTPVARIDKKNLREKEDNDRKTQASINNFV